MSLYHDEDNLEPIGEDELSELFALSEGESAEFVAENESPQAAFGMDDECDAEPDGEPVLPTEADLESRGFSQDEVRRLVLISDRQADSSESRIAEAALRRMRFARWLVEHGVLDEWSA